MTNLNMNVPRPRWLPSTLLLFLTIALSIAVSLPVFAQGGDDNTPTPTPTNDTPEEEIFKYDEPAYVEAGNSVWTVSDSTFKTNYPDGFEFEAIATSSAGELVSASVFFSHNPDWKEDRRMRGEVDPETGWVFVKVAGRDADGIPPWVEVNYRWRLSDSEGNVYWSEWFTGAEYEDDTRHWNREESEDVLIFWEDGFPQEGVDLSFEAMAQARQKWITGFGRVLSYKPRMILFANRDTFTEWRAFEYGEAGTVVVGQAFAGWGAFIQVIHNNNLRGLAFQVVVHEITHLYQFDVYDLRGPGWWFEGNATYFELEPSYDYETRVRRAAENGQLPRLFENGGPNTGAAGPDGLGRWGYDVGYTFNKWLIDNYGWEAHLEIAEKLGEPEEIAGHLNDEFFEEVLEDVLGITVEEMESQWRVWLGASSDLPTLIPTPTIFMNFPPTVTPFIFPTASDE